MNCNDFLKLSLTEAQSKIPLVLLCDASVLSDVNIIFFKQAFSHDTV